MQTYNNLAKNSTFAQKKMKNAYFCRRYEKQRLHRTSRWHRRHGFLGHVVRVVHPGLSKPESHSNHLLAPCDSDNISHNHFVFVSDQ